MCGGNTDQQQQGGGDPDAPPARRRHRRLDSLRRTRAGNPLPSAVAAAIDSPPPVASPTGPTPSSPSVWQLREARHQTPQLLATLDVDDAVEQDLQENRPPQPSERSLAVSCAVIVDETYLVVGTDQGTLVVWDLAKVVHVEASTGLAPRRSSPQSSSHPLPSSDADPGTDTAAATPSAAPTSPRVVDLKQGEGRRGHDILGRVVGLSRLKDPRFDSTLSSPSENLVVVATEWGVVAVVDVGSGDVLCRFETGRCSVTSVAALPPSSSSPTTLLLGHQTGAVECWALREMAAAPKDAPKNVPTKRFKAHLVGRGSLESGFPVRSLCALSVRPEGSVAQGGHPPSSHASSVQEASSGKAGIAERERQYAMMTFESNRQISAPRVVKVVDVTSLVAAFSSIEDDDGDEYLRAGESTIRLEDHWVLPGAGMELVDPSLPFAARTPFQTQWIPSAGSNHLLNVPGVGVAFSCADGTVGIMRASSSRSGSDGLSWGIVQRSDQLLLSYPAIGMGAVTMPSPEEGDNATTQYLACCLRGGTVYLVPLDSAASAADDEPPRPLKVVTYPNDLDTDVAAIQQVQFFTAGSVRSCAGGPATHAVPVLVYAWPGGIIDIYACHLQTTTWPPSGILERLVENGSAQLLQELLLSPGIDVALRGPLWAEAKGELLQRLRAGAGSEDSHPISLLTTSDLEGDRLRAVRTLLLQLSASASLSA